MLLDRHEGHGIILSDKLDGSHLFCYVFLVAGSCRSKAKSTQTLHVCPYHFFILV